MAKAPTARVALGDTIGTGVRLESVEQARNHLKGHAPVDHLTEGPS